MVYTVAEAIRDRVRNESDGQDKDWTWCGIYLQSASQWEERVQEKSWVTRDWDDVRTMRGNREHKEKEVWLTQTWVLVHRD